MKNLILLSAIASLTLVGCQSEDEFKKDFDNSNTISFNPYLQKLMKGSDAVKADLEKGINVYAYKADEGFSEKDPYIDGVIFEKKDGNTYWTSTPVKNWPTYALSFIGYYPKTVGPNDIKTPNVFSYTVLDDIDAQEDILLAFTQNKYRANPVEMKFHHALSKVNFEIGTVANCGLNVEVHSITVKNVPSSADFTYAPHDLGVPLLFTINNTAGVKDFIYNLASSVTVTASDQIEKSDKLSGFYLIPHAISKWVYGENSYDKLATQTYINLNATFTGSAERTGNIAIPIQTTSWQPGMSYTYTIMFGDSNGTSGGGGYDPDINDDDKPQQILTPINMQVDINYWKIELSENVNL